MLVVPKEGALALMDFIRSQLPNPISVHLYVNNVSPDEDSTIATFTEATFPGYGVGLTDFPTDAFTNGDGQAEIDGGSPAFFSSSGTSTQTAYGYFVDDGTYTTLLWAERFTSPVSFTTPGQFCEVQLKLTGVSAFSG